MTEPAQIYLSPPDVGELERSLLLDAFDSNWIAPLGPHVDAFEAEFVELTGTARAVALSSGTAGLHLALVGLGIGPADEVIVPSLTFAASAFAVTYVGARPVFIDSESATWNLDPALLESVLVERAARNALPAAVMVVDLYGQCADYDAIEEICSRFEVPLIEDAAEGLGATWHGRPAGSFGYCGVFSFNGNKIITTSGGGMAVSNDESVIEAMRHRSTQAREPVPHYEHRIIGYNYRLSNLLAAVGRGQLAGLSAKIARRREISDRYRTDLAGVPGISFNPIDERGTSNYWLTIAQLDPHVIETTPTDVMNRLQATRIETRPAWKPMHLQPVFAGHEMTGGAVAEQVFDRGVCLPSGSSLSFDDQTRVIAEFRAALRP